MKLEIPRVTRVEVIDETGRSYVNWFCDNVNVQFQDDNRTLKIFITKDEMNVHLRKQFFCIEDFAAYVAVVAINEERK